VVVVGFGEFVRQLGASDVTDPPSVLGGGEAGADEEMAFAGAGVAEQHDGFVVVDERAVAEHRDHGRCDVRVRVEIELVEGLHPWESGFVDAAGAASFVADVELDLECFSEERGMRHPPTGGIITESFERWGEAGEGELSAGVGGDRGVGDRGWCGGGLGHSGFAFWSCSMVSNWS
jgi:hypothetical protein